jgi:transposase
MSRRLPELGERRLPELKEAWQSERRDWARQRLRVIRLVARHEHSAQEIAEVVGVSRATVFNYLRAFEEKGVAGLLRRDYGTGRPGLIDGRLQRELVGKLRGGAFVRAKDAHLVRQLLGSLLHRQLSKRLREILKFQIFQGLVLVACHQRVIAD